MSIDEDLIAELQDSLAELGTVLSRDLKHRRLRLGPILSERDLLDVDLIAELQDSLAELGTVLSRDVIQSWTPQQFFEALHYCRAMHARLEPPPDVPQKPDFIP